MRKFVILLPITATVAAYLMKLFDTLLLSLGVALLIMGVYEMMAAGPMYAYSFLMPAIIVFLWFVYRKRSKV